MGIVFVALAMVWADGVAMAQIKSTLLFTKRWAIVCRLDWSAWAFCTSYFTFLPSSNPFFFMPSMKPLRESSNAWCSTSCTMPTLYTLAASFFGASAFLSPPPQPAAANAIMERSIPTAKNLLLLKNIHLPSFVNIFT